MEFPLQKDESSRYLNLVYRRYKADTLPQIRRMAYEDLDQTMYAILKGTLEYLQRKGGCIDPMTLQAYEYFKAQMKGNEE